jgi:acyl-CoA synthetase (AMP-forming)/AMP-acid ligase II/acyl carrier protein
MLNPTSFPTYAHMMWARAEAHGDREALVFLADGETEQARWTYGRVDTRARAVAATLAAHACKPGDRALLLYPPGLEFAAAFLGCLYAGVIAVPAYPPRSAEHERATPRLAGIVRDAGPTIVLTTSTRPQHVVRDTMNAITGDADRQLECIDTESIPDTTGADWRPAADPTPDSIAFLQYTSGSTSAPKGVVLTHRNLMHNSAAIRDAFGHTESTPGLVWLPPYHDMGLIGGILNPLFSGTQVALMPPAAFLQKPLRWLKAVSDWGVYTSGGPDFAYDLCIRSIKPADRATLDLSAWTVAFTGAEPVRKSTIDRFVEAFAPCGFRREAFYPCYGLAESTLFVTGGRRLTGAKSVRIDPDGLRQNRVTSPAGSANELVGCGAPAADGAELRIVNPQTCVPCAADEVGEIWLRSASVAQGYWQKPEQTAATFAARLASEAVGGRGWLRTGDLGFFADGELCVAGRCKDLIIVRGRNHHPHDLEHSASTSHAALRPGGAAAVGVDVNGAERLVIYHEVERTQRDADPNEIFAAVRESIASAHELQTHAIVLLKPGHLPRTSSGKVRRFACRDAFVTNTDLGEIARWEMPAVPEVEQVVSELSNVRTNVGTSGAEALETAQGLESWLLTKLAAVVGAPVSELDPAAPFAQYGLDSASAVALSGEIATELKMDLEATLFWDHPTLSDLAAHLATLRAAGGPQGAHKAA